MDKHYEDITRCVEMDKEKLGTLKDMVKRIDATLQQTQELSRRGWETAELCTESCDLTRYREEVIRKIDSIDNDDDEQNYLFALIEFEKTKQVERDKTLIRHTLRETGSSSAPRHSRSEIAGTRSEGDFSPQSSQNELKREGEVLLAFGFELVNNAKRKEDTQEYEAFMRKTFKTPKTIAEAKASRHVSAEIDANTQSEINHIQGKYCAECKGANIVRESAFYTCTDCGIQKRYYDDTRNNIPYNDAPPDRNFRGQYKRSNHFRECVAMAQGSENTEFCQDHLDAIHNRIFRVRKWTRQNVTPTTTIEILKELGYTTLYDHAAKICLLMGGTVSIKFNQREEDALYAMFHAAERVYDHMPSELRRNGTNNKVRKNFPGYDYTIYKLLEIMGYDMEKYGVDLKIPKDTQILKSHDHIWEYICKKLRWKFTKTSNRTKC